MIYKYIELLKEMEILMSNNWYDVTLSIFITISIVAIAIYQIYDIYKICTSERLDSIGEKKTIFMPIMVLAISPILGLMLGALLFACSPIIIIGLICYFIDKRIKLKYKKL